VKDTWRQQFVFSSLNTVTSSHKSAVPTTLPAKRTCEHIQDFFSSKSDRTVAGVKCVLLTAGHFRTKQYPDNIAKVSLFLSTVFPCEIFKAAHRSSTSVAHDFARRVNLKELYSLKV
jgi:hypothetical protein